MSGELSDPKTPLVRVLELFLPQPRMVGGMVPFFDPGHDQGIGWFWHFFSSEARLGRPIARSETSG